MDNYLWEIFSTSKQIIEDHVDQQLQIPFQINGFCQQDQIHHQDLKGGPHETSSVNRNNTKKELRRRARSTSDDSNKMKKVVHRNVERHRRQEMANLHTKLRSILPLEFIKGKRSASDHMQEAVNYIRHLQKNIEGLDNTREKIKNSSNFGAENGSTTSASYVHKYAVTVNPCQDGMEILIVNSCREEMVPLSKVLGELLQEGLNVVSCVYSKQDEWTLIRIQCQVSDISSVSADGLQKILSDAVNKTSIKE